MIVIIGCIVVMGSVIAGFMLSGGHVGALIHPAEILTIGGAAGGALIIMSSKKILQDLMKGIMATLKGPPFGKDVYRDLFKMMYEVMQTARRDGLLSLEPHLSKPHDS